MIAPLALAALAIALAWPIPLLLARATWPARAPAAALLLWQSIAIAGGLSMIGALLTFGLAPFGDNLVSGAIGLATRGVLEVSLPHALALAGAALFAFHLLLNFTLTIVRSERQRRRHAQLLFLLSSPLPSGSRMLDSPAPVAYCLPGAVTSVTVVSAGLVELLDDDEMTAVIEHEKAHVTQRHDVVLIAFRAWYASLPWFPIAFRAQREVGLLIEMLADDRARRVVPDSVLARAIVLVGAERGSEPVTASLPDWGDAASIDQLRNRLARLDTRPLSDAAEAAVVVAAVALLTVPTVLLFAPGAAALL
ncbi:integral membrane protein [Salinibacterium xinjiangense]|uniref:Peptidase family M48 n=1 Tax=Salinibacterium xinjiangense TaxID=386302 RepID=A0A2C9A174_9MICO|nr:M56 family metallopeptidase [Salinibacterium xinjiangense]GGL04364.1 integral membrane protein [Salinibacterium xinjiangense]SOE72745.1 Peptidase family M48 [Salinibacterium xinjiangense]